MSLSPNNNLLNYNFETYRISLKKLESISKDFNCELYDWNNGNLGAHFSQVKAFGMHNNIVLDDFSPMNAYFISKDLVIYEVSLYENIFGISDAKIVYTSPEVDESQTKRSPPVLFFPSSTISCFYDGINSLSILYTNNRCTKASGDDSSLWKLLCCTTIDASDCDATLLECRVEEVEKNSTDTDSILNDKILHCCFLKILNTTFNENIELVWTKFKCLESHQLYKLEEKIWRGASPPEMVTFSSDFTCLEIVGDHSFRYCPSGITIDTLTCDNIKSLASWWKDSNEYVTARYYLNMAADDFTIDILYPVEDKGEDKYLVIMFTVKDKEPMELYREKMYCTIDKDLSKWHVENEILVIELKKIDSEEFESVASKKSKVTFDENEEVDNCEDSEMGLISFDYGSGRCIEEIGLSKNEWLFKTRLRANEPWSPCIRYNVDGLLWSKGPGNTPWIHTHTLNAFGYVLASKVDRKFMVCSLPEKQEENGVQFAVISDWKRSICVFMQYNKLDGDMSVKNRCTGHVVSNVADELFVSLDQCHEIMGLVANSTAVYVLYKTSEGRLRLTVVNCVLQ